MPKLTSNQLSQLPPSPRADEIKKMIGRPLSMDRILHLKMLNEDRVHEYYRNIKVAGPERGENTIMETVFAALASANRMARQGKEWEPL